MLITYQHIKTFRVFAEARTRIPVECILLTANSWNVFKTIKD